MTAMCSGLDVSQKQQDESIAKGPIPPPEEIQDDPMILEDDLKTPKIGMKFNSYEEVCDFYKEYAQKTGFHTMKRRSKKCENGVLRYFTLSCARTGMPRNPNKNPIRGRSSIKIGCQARINATLGEDGLFFLSLVETNHNHEINPSKIKLGRGKKRKDSSVKMQLELNDQAGEPLSKNLKRSHNSVKCFHDELGDPDQMVRFNQLNASFNYVVDIGLQSEYLCKRAKSYLSEMVDKLTEDKAVMEKQENIRTEFFVNVNNDDFVEGSTESSTSKRKGRPPTKHKVSTIEKGVVSGENKAQQQDPPRPPEGLSLEEQNLRDDPVVLEDDPTAPKIGMKFNSYEEVCDFYTGYSLKKGFDIMKRRSKKCENGVLRYFTLTCARSGLPRNPNENPVRGRSSIKIGCQARINATLGEDGLFFLSLVEINHNHETNPSRVRLFRRNKHKDSYFRKRSKLNDQAGIAAASIDIQTSA